MSAIRFQLFVIWFALHSVFAFAQELSTRFDTGINYGVGDGLGSNQTTEIVEDDYGFLWVGTESGVSRFDGTSFQNFEFIDSYEVKQPIGFITSLFYDKVNKFIWVSTFSGLFHTRTDKINFQEFILDESISDKNLKRVNSIVSDKKNNLWIVGKVGLCSINLSKLEDKRVHFNSQNSLFNRSNVVMTDPFDENGIWIGTTKGLVYFNSQSENYISYLVNNSENGKENLMRKLFVDKEYVYVGTWQSGVLKFDKKAKNFKYLFNSELLNSGHKTVIKLYPYGDNLWISTSLGLIEYNLRNESLVGLLEHDYEKNLLIGLSFIDSNKNAWFCHKKGLFRYGKSNYIDESIVLEKRSDFEKPLVIEKIIKMDGYFYVVGYKSSGVYKVSSDNLSFTIIRLPEEHYDEAGLIDITDMIEVDDTTLLLITDNKFFIFNTISNEIRLASLQVDFDNPAFQSVVKFNSENTYWVGSRRGGLFKVDFENQKITQFKNQFNSNQRDEFPWINYMFKDSGDKLWLARGSYTVLDLKSETVYNLDKKKGLNYFQDASCFLEDNSGRIWIAGMSHGLGYTNFSDFYNGITQFSNDKVNSLYRLNDSLIWTLGDNLGILDTSKLTHRILNTRTEENRSLTGPVIPISESTYFMGSENGLLKLVWKNNNETIELPKPYISEIYNNDMEIKGLGLENHKVSFPKGTSELVAKIGALSFNYPYKINYQYALNNRWIDVPENNEISIVNIEPGTLDVRLRIKGQDPEYSKSDYTLSIYVPKPLWKTNSAYIIYVLLLGSLFIGISRLLMIRKLAVAETQRLKDIDKLKNSLFTNITHEFRTPITVILGMVESMKNKANKIDLGKSLSLMQSNCENLLQMVNNMLSLTQLENSQVQLNSIQSDIIQYIRYLFQNFESLAFEKDINYTFQSDVDHLLMDYDVEKLAVVVNNLLINAIKFTPEKGMVKMNLERFNHTLKISIIDSGIGIAEEDIAHVFNKFFQVENGKSNTQVGSGIGLALVKEYVELMQGEIKVKSQQGLGSIFTVRLPVNNKEKSVKIESPLIKKPDSKYVADYLNDSNFEDLLINDGSLPIALIVEDNRDIAFYLKNCLSDYYKVHFAKDGEEGLKKAYKYVPDIIISDVMMPKLNGFELCSKLKSEPLTNHIPIILLTAKATDKDRIEGLSSGADAYLIKPFNKEELFVRLNQLISIRRKMIEKFSSIGFMENKSKDPETEFLELVVSVVLMHIDNPKFGTPQLAFEINLSESQIYRKIKAITNKSTAIFIRSVRLNRAKLLLKTTNKNISEVAYEVGFNDPSWFSRAFKEEFGISPRDFQKTELS